MSINDLVKHVFFSTLKGNIFLIFWPLSAIFRTEFASYLDCYCEMIKSIVKVILK